MLGPSRNSRISSMLQKAIATIICHQIKDPRIGHFVSVSDVDLSKDKAHARVYITMLGSNEEHEDAVKVLNKASSFIRSKLIKAVVMRYIPNLRFYMDRSIIEGQHIATLLDDKSKEE